MGHMDKQWDKQTDKQWDRQAVGRAGTRWEKQDAIFADVPSRRCDWMDDYDGAPRRYRRVGEGGTEPDRNG